MGGVTLKKRWKSASAGGRRLSSAYVAMKARYWPCLSVNLSGEVLDWGSAV